MFFKSFAEVDKKTKKIFRVSFMPMVLLTVLTCGIFAAMLINTINTAVEANISGIIQKVSDDINFEIKSDTDVVRGVTAYAQNSNKKENLKLCVNTLAKNLHLSDNVYYLSNNAPEEKNNSFFVLNSSWEPDVDLSTRDWFVHAMENNGRLTYTPPYVDAMTGDVVITVSQSATDKKGTKIGVAAIDIYLKRLSAIYSSVEISKSSVIYLISDTGLYLINDDPSKILTCNYFDESKIPFTAKEYLTGETKAKIVKGLKYYSVAKIGDAPWFVVTEGNMSDFGGAFMCTMIILIIFFLALSFILAVYIVRFVMSFQKKETEMGKKLFVETQNLVVASKETAATSQDQNAAVKEIVATMEDTNNLSENIAAKIHDVNSVANKTTSDVADGAVALQHSIDKLHEISVANNQTIEGIKDLSKEVDNIWDIVSLITSVADQAKIIAFNAELEAASAGEAGKNFHIVASEIRRLADGIIDSTKEIKDRISGIQHSSDSLILASESGTVKVEEGVETAKELENRFASIKSAAEITAKSANDITTIIQQQTSASEQILVTLKQISVGVENFSSATESISSAAENLRQIAEKLDSSINDDGESK